LIELGRRQLLKLSGIAAFDLLAGKGQVRPMKEHRLEGAQESAGGRPRAGDPGLLTLFLCGDVMTGRGVDQVMPHPSNPRIYEPSVSSAAVYVELAERVNGPIPKPVSFAYVWGDTLAEFERVSPDVRIVNLETSVTTSEERLPKGINYRMHPDNVPCFTAARIDCCALANNHVLDWGKAGLEETLETLRKAGLKTAGAGRDDQEAAAPAIIEVEGKGRVIVFSFGSGTSGIPASWAATSKSPGVHLLPDLSEATADSIARRVRAVRRERDIVVASIHWGENWGYRIPPEQRSFARELIDAAGVDIVHGHSSHHAKGIEVHAGRPILYGCGDFLSDYEGISGYEGFRNDLSLMYFPSMDPSTGKLVRLEMTPLQIRRFRLNRVAQEDALWLRDVLKREGEKLGTGVELNENGTLTLDW
jgi:poly-gamma-glutamate synthesis protein (capsule biosynthesis protein)